MAVGRSGERWVPPVEVVGELVVEDPDTDLQQEVRAARGPAHLLLLDHALADQLVDRGLDERGRDGLALSLIHISEPTRLGMISYAVFCLKKKKTKNITQIPN